MCNKKPSQSGMPIGIGIALLCVLPIFGWLIHFCLKHFRREPHNLLRPSKTGVTDDEKLEKVKPTATRNLILIRHGQYNLNGSRDEERFLTALGTRKKIEPLIDWSNNELCNIILLCRYWTGRLYRKETERIGHALFISCSVVHVQSEGNSQDYFRAFAKCCCQNLWPTPRGGSLSSGTACRSLETGIPCKYLIGLFNGHYFVCLSVE